ncbi:MAG: dephospho-CoA kinase [Alphaproteobacteria bacterium]|nr:MAG: dephospho-CoA kinase [Alphaproteobacteria bacterium]
MIVLGLTGSIAMGKSETARMLRRLGMPVFDSDAAVHRIFANDREVIRAIAKRFPDCLVDGRVDRGCLGRHVFADPGARRWLEGLIHPRVRCRTRRFLQCARRQRRPLVVLDIPLLFETGGESRVDRIAVVSAPAFVQRSRAMARPGMTAERLAGILASQTSDAIKRRQADFVLPSGGGRRLMLRAIHRMLEQLASPAGIPARRRKKRNPFDA